MEKPHRIKKYNIKIKILELIEAFLIYKKKSILFLTFYDPHTQCFSGGIGLRPQTPTFTLYEKLNTNGGLNWTNQPNILINIIVKYSILPGLVVILNIKYK